MLCFNGFHGVSVSPAIARSKGLPVGVLDNLFVVLVAVVVATVFVRRQSI